MVKSFINSFFGGFGRTFGRIIAYLIIGLIFFLIYDNVHAAAIYGPSSCTATHYRIIKNDEFGTDTHGVTSTTYNIPWSVIAFYGTENMEANTYYDVKITFINNIPSNFIRNVEFYQTSSLCGTQSGSFNASFGYTGKVLTFRVLTGPSLVDYWQVWLTLSGATNSNGISTVTLSKVDMSGSSGIIENANENTNTIINNQNENTQDVIDNQNQNTQDIIDSQEDINNSLNSSCKTGPYVLEGAFIGDDNKYLDSSGQLITTSSGFVTKYISVIPSSTYTLTYNDDVPSTYYVCTYLNNKTLSSCFALHGGGNGALYNHTFTLNNFISYIRVSVRKSRRFTLTGPVCNDWAFEQQQEINNFLNDHSDGDTSLFFTWWSNFNPGSNPLGNVITLPITLVEKFVSFNSSSCQPVNLGSLLGTDLVLPCFTLYSVLPSNASTLINVVDTIMCVALLVIIIKNAYETIANLISLGGENKVKAHFRIPTPLEFLSGVLNGDGYSEYVDYR